MLQTSDPLADAVIEELHTGGPPVNAALHDGLQNGLASLTEGPSAVAAFLRELEAVPPWVEPDILERGSAAYLTIEPLWNDIALSVGSLIHIYCAPAIAKVLASTRDLIDQEPATHRLVETALWVYKVMLPGGLHRGAPGYVATAQVRLLHARIRRYNLQRGWAVEEWGLPINQVDMARTWLDFTYVPYRALTTFGFDFTDPELRDAYHLWQYLGYLLGIDTAFFRDPATKLDINSHLRAEPLLKLTEATNGPPDDDSRALTAPMRHVVAASIVDALKTPFPLTSDVTTAMVRFIHGDAIADALRLPRTDMTQLMPVLAFANRSARMLQRNIPGAWIHLTEQSAREYTKLIAENTTPAEYQRKLQTPAATAPS